MRLVDGYTPARLAQHARRPEGCLGGAAVRVPCKIPLAGDLPTERAFDAVNREVVRSVCAVFSQNFAHCYAELISQLVTQFASLGMPCSSEVGLPVKAFRAVKSRAEP